MESVCYGAVGQEAEDGSDAVSLYPQQQPVAAGSLHSSPSPPAGTLPHWLWHQVAAA